MKLFNKILDRFDLELSKKERDPKPLIAQLVQLLSNEETIEDAKALYKKNNWILPQNRFDELLSHELEQHRAKANPELALSKSQRKVVEDVKDGKNIFVTGKAGAGKSFLLNFLKTQYPQMIMTASTGAAAVKIEGITLHSWGCLGLGDYPAEEVAKKMCAYEKRRNQIRNTKMLAIDEISMINAELLDKLDKALKIARKNNLPFGGIQILLFGDFLQLPPVNKPTEDKPELKYCFKSDAWKEAHLSCHVLERSFRQNDNSFESLLDRIRIGKCLPSDSIKIQERIQTPPKYIKPVELVSHNIKADRINQKELEKLSSPSEIYEWKEDYKEEHYIKILRKGTPASSELELKIGTQVMMLCNSFQEYGIVNGSKGEIINFSEDGNWPVVRFENGRELRVETHKWSIGEYNFEEEAYEQFASISQIPLRLAWAITIHKSQGMSLDYAYCDLGECFADGQVYVALSRLKSLNGLFIKSFNEDRIKADNAVVEFYEEIGH